MPKYVIRAPRVIDGTYHNASMAHPVVIELPEGYKLDPGLEPLKGELAPVKLKNHFATGVVDPVKSAASFHSTPVAVAPSSPASAPVKPGKRSSDNEPV